MAEHLGDQLKALPPRCSRNPSPCQIGGGFPYAARWGGYFYAVFGDTPLKRILRHFYGILTHPTITTL